MILNIEPRSLLLKYYIYKSMRWCLIPTENSLTLFGMVLISYANLLGD